MKLKTSKKVISTLGLVLCFFVIFSFILRDSSDLVSAVCCAVCVMTLAAIVIISYTFYRCPHCRGYFKAMDIGGKVKHCPYCGKEIDMEAAVHRGGRWDTSK